MTKTKLWLRAMLVAVQVVASIIAIGFFIRMMNKEDWTSWIGGLIGIMGLFSLFVVSLEHLVKSWRAYHEPRKNIEDYNKSRR